MGEPSVTEHLGELAVAINDYGQLPNITLQDTLHLREKAEVLRQNFQTAVELVQNQLKIINEDKKPLRRLERLSVLLVQTNQLQELNRQLEAINANFLSDFLHRNGLSIPQSST